MIGAATLVAMMAGLAYAASPFTVLFVVAMVWLIYRAGAGLQPREATWVRTLLVIAILVRLVALAAVFVATDPWRQPFNTLFGDGRAIVQRAMMTLNMWRDVEIGPANRLVIFNPYGASGYYGYLAFLQLLFGKAPYGLVLVSTASLMAAAVVVFRTTRARGGRPAALFAFAVLLFWPSLFVWSISALRETVQVLASVVAVVAAVEAVRSERWTQSGAYATAALVALAFLQSLRAGSMAIAIGAIACAFAVHAVTRRAWVFAAAAVVLPLAVATAVTRPAIRNRIESEVRVAAGRHIGHVKTVGNSFRAVDQRFYSNWPRDDNTMTVAEELRFLGRAGAAFVLAPLPWQLTSDAQLAIVPQQLAWYVLVVLALIGTWAGMRRDPMWTAAMAGYCLTALALIAPNSGNIGTLIRHRDAVVPFLAALGGIGVAQLLVRPR